MTLTFIPVRPDAISDISDTKIGKWNADGDGNADGVVENRTFLPAPYIADGIAATMLLKALFTASAAVAAGQQTCTNLRDAFQDNS